MSETSEADENAIAFAFWSRFEADLAARGAARPLADYQAEYPGFEDVIAREHLALDAARGGRSRTAHPPHEPETLSPKLGARRYRTCGELARGGMGIVFRVRDEHLGRDLAMKVLTAEHGAPSSRSLHRFLDEARITSRLVHPGIPAIHDLGIDEDGRAYFTMRLVEGRSFAAIIAAVHAGEPAWSLARALRVLQSICETVAFAHGRGVIHRDLKPGNVMVGAHGDAYVLDWGLARAIRSAEREARLAAPAAGATELTPASPLCTAAGDVIGTPAYMAPEQARGDIDQVDERSDVYALGAMLYHLLTGSMPYASASEAPSSSAEVLSSVRSGPPPAVSAIRPGIHPELVAICDKAMRRKPAERYAGPAALRADLRAFLELRAVSSGASGPLAAASR